MTSGAHPVQIDIRDTNDAACNGHPRWTRKGKYSSERRRSSEQWTLFLHFHVQDHPLRLKTSTLRFVHVEEKEEEGCLSGPKLKQQIPYHADVTGMLRCTAHYTQLTGTGKGRIKFTVTVVASVEIGQSCVLAVQAVEQQYCLRPSPGKTATTGPERSVFSHCI